MSAYPPLLSIRGAVVAVLLAVGTGFLIAGTVGLLRLPNVYNRMHATSKAATLGTSSILLAVTVTVGPQGAGLTSLVGIVFLFLTAPTGAHVISRAAQKMGVPLDDGITWPGTSGGRDDGGNDSDESAAEAD